jgi:hypothetical protein
VILVALALALAAPRAARAAPAAAGATPTPARATAARTTRPAPRKVLRLEELEIQGRVHKPQAVFLLPRAQQVQHETADRLDPLLPKLTQALEMPLFDAPPATPR